MHIEKDSSIMTKSINIPSSRGDLYLICQKNIQSSFDRTYIHLSTIKELCHVVISIYHALHVAFVYQSIFRKIFHIRKYEKHSFQSMQIIILNGMEQGFCSEDLSSQSLIYECLWLFLDFLFSEVMLQWLCHCMYACI